MRGGILIFGDGGFRPVLLGMMALGVVLEIVYLTMYLVTDAELWELIVWTMGSDILLIFCAYLYGHLAGASPPLLEGEMTCRYGSSDGIVNVFEESNGRD